eukprot:scaffold4415_cov170-Ochromonas_danica.AAC.4
MDPKQSTPKELYGEVAYKSFVEKNDPDALLVRKYDLITRVRETKLLTQLADSGLLEALESKGLTLSKVEKLLPVIDEFNLLPLLVKNKEVVLGLAPWLIEPAPLMLPLTANIIKANPKTFLLPGAALLLLGLVEWNQDGFLAASAILLGLPVLSLGGLLGLLDNASKAATAVTSTPTTAAKAKVVEKKSFLPVFGGARPVVAVKKAEAKPTAARKVVKVNPDKVKVATTTTLNVSTPKPIAKPVAVAKPAAPAPIVKSAPVKVVAPVKPVAIVAPVKLAAPVKPVPPVVKAAAPAPKPVVKAAAPAPKPVVKAAAPAPKPAVKAVPVVKAVAKGETRKRAVVRVN